MDLHPGPDPGHGVYAYDLGLTYTLLRRRHGDPTLPALCSWLGARAATRLPHVAGARVRLRGRLRLRLRLRVRLRLRLRLTGAP